MDTEYAETLFARARHNMVVGQLTPNKITDRRIVAAFGSVPRERFVPKAKQGVAYLDEDIAIKPGRYLMEPMVFARMLQAAEIQPNDAVLDIGCASGYSVAVLAQLAARVVGLEEDSDLAEQAKRGLHELGVANAAIITAPLRGGEPSLAPYDVILFEGALHQVPAAVLDQLSEGGRLLAAIRDDAGGGQAMLFKRTGAVHGHRALFDALIPALPGFDQQKAFEF